MHWIIRVVMYCIAILFILFIGASVWLLSYDYVHFIYMDNVGNKLQEYYGNMYNKFSQEDGNAYHYLPLAFGKGPSESVLTYLPQKTRRPPGFKDSQNYHEAMKNIGGHLWELSDVGDFWLSMAPTMQRQLDAILLPLFPGCSFNRIVLHFRCSDEPFQRHPSYCFAKYSFWKESIERILGVVGANGSPNPSVKILWAFGHRSNAHNKRAASIYKDSLLGFLEKTFPFLAVSIDSGSVLQDFQEMRCARYLVAPPSSFSLLAAVSGHQDMAIIMRSPFTERAPLLPKHIISVENCSVSHDLIKDYEDTASVISLLNK
jgi:hypothetical protein